MKNMQPWKILGIGIIIGMLLINLTSLSPHGNLYKWNRIQEKIENCETRFEMKCGTVVLPWIEEVKELEKKYNE